jgi:hypothetical protein
VVRGPWGPAALLVVFVDDATGKLMELRFCDWASTFEYWTSVRRYLQRHGRPVAFYSDKATVFRVNRKDHGGSGITQFVRAMSELNIDVICVNTPAAKGRVERTHHTLYKIVWSRNCAWPASRTRTSLLRVDRPGAFAEWEQASHAACAHKPATWTRSRCLPMLAQYTGGSP